MGPFCLRLLPFCLSLAFISFFRRVKLAAKINNIDCSFISCLISRAPPLLRRRFCEVESVFPVGMGRRMVALSPLPARLDVSPLTLTVLLSPFFSKIRQIRQIRFFKHFL